MIKLLIKFLDNFILKYHKCYKYKEIFSFIYILKKDGTKILKNVKYHCGICDKEIRTNND